MPKRRGVCRVCGKEYQVCNTVTPTMFNWREVACSPECGQEYFRQVAEARSQDEAAEAKKTVAEAEEQTEQAFNPDAEIEHFFDV